MKPILFSLIFLHLIFLPGLAGKAFAQKKRVAEEEVLTPTRILIVYHSQEGHTREMAEAVERGALSVPQTTVWLRSIAQATRQELLAADAIILGSPVHNASIAPELQQYINQWPFEGQPLKNKLGAAFVSAGGVSAGEELVQLSILHSMLIFGMVVTGGGEWQQAFGASVITDEPPFNQVDNQAPFLQKGRTLGKRVAELAKRLKE
jgi:NAD(P)H dehydrogenase (quinone)